MRIVEDDLSGAEIGALLSLHLAEAQANSPAGFSFALNIDRLRAPDVTFWSLWEGDELAGCAALKQLAADHGEIKSMRTAPGHLRKGVAAQLIAHLVTESRRRGYARLSLETGSTPAYAPALALYTRHGFTEGEQFGGYTASDFNRFYHLTL